MNTCKDVEFARRVVAQMKDLRLGRRQSTQAPAQSPRYDVPKVGEKWCVPVRIETPAGWVTTTTTADRLDAATTLWWIPNPEFVTAIDGIL